IIHAGNFLLTTIFFWGYSWSQVVFRGPQKDIKGLAVDAFVSISFTIYITASAALPFLLQLIQGHFAKQTVPTVDRKLPVIVYPSLESTPPLIDQVHSPNDFVPYLQRFLHEISYCYQVSKVPDPECIETYHVWLHS